MSLQEPGSQTLLNIAIQQAIADPIAANLPQLTHEFDQLIGQLPKTTQLLVAGEVLERLAEIISARAQSLLDEWEDKHNPIQAEPILTITMLQAVLRQSMTLNLEELIKDSATQPAFVPVESIAGAVEKSRVLELATLLDEAQTKQEVLSLAHQEDVSVWIQEIHKWMQRAGKEVSLTTLQTSLQKPLVEVWLGLLLGGFVLEQRGNFYQAEEVWIKKIGSAQDAIPI